MLILATIKPTSDGRAALSDWLCASGTSEAMQQFEREERLPVESRLVITHQDWRQMSTNIKRYTTCGRRPHVPERRAPNTGGRVGRWPLAEPKAGVTG